MLTQIVCVVINCTRPVLPVTGIISVIHDSRFTSPRHQGDAAPAGLATQQAELPPPPGHHDNDVQGKILACCAMCSVEIF